MAWENPGSWPVIDVNVVSGGGSGGDTNITQVGGDALNLGPDASVTGANSVPTVFPTGYTVPISGTVTATLGALVAGTAVIGKVGIDQTTPGTTNAVQLVTGTTGGWTTKSNIIPGTTTGILVKTGAGLLGVVQAFNLGSVPLFIHWYDAVTVTGTPIWRTVIPGPPAGGGGYIAEVPQGLTFSTGLIYYVSTVITDGDATAPVASTSIVNIGYK